MKRWAVWVGIVLLVGQPAITRAASTPSHSRSRTKRAAKHRPAKKKLNVLECNFQVFEGNSFDSSPFKISFQEDSPRQSQFRADLRRTQAQVWFNPSLGKAGFSILESNVFVAKIEGDTTHDGNFDMSVNGPSKSSASGSNKTPSASISQEKKYRVKCQVVPSL